MVDDLLKKQFYKIDNLPSTFIAKSSKKKVQYHIFRLATFVVLANQRYAFTVFTRKLKLDKESERF